MQTAAVQVQYQDGDSHIRVDGAVSAQLVADLRQVSSAAERWHLDLRGAWLSTDGAVALRAWQQAARGRLELVLPGALGAAPLEPGEAPASPGSPVDLPDLLAHEVRGPLAVAHLRLQTLANRLQQQGLADEATSCQGAISGLEAVARLLDIYLTASRPWQSRPVDLQAVCRAAAAAAAELDAAERVSVHTHGLEAATAPLVHGEASALHQMLWNLVRNALEASAPGGGVRIDLRATARAHLTLQVHDEGPGFPPEVLATPFQPKRSVKPGGMGIGLVLCHWIVERHQGRITLANGPRGGSVSVVLPRALGAQPSGGRGLPQH